LFQKALGANEGSVDVSILPLGTYFVKVFADHQVQTIKVIKE